MPGGPEMNIGLAAEVPSENMSWKMMESATNMLLKSL